MGSCISSSPNHLANFDMNNYYKEMEVKRRQRKRNYRAHVSDDESSLSSTSNKSITPKSLNTTGILNALQKPVSSEILTQSDPLPRSIFNQKSSNPRAKAFSLERRIKPKSSLNINEISICDDFNSKSVKEPPKPNGEADALNQTFTVCSNLPGHNNSTLYTTAKLMESQNEAEPSVMSSIRSNNASIEQSRKTGPGKMEMEIYMMIHTNTILPRTSSPIPSRRANPTNVIDEDEDMEMQVEEEDSKSMIYRNWSNDLNEPVSKAVMDVSILPEALSGGFCNYTYSVYHDALNMENFPKRFKSDEESSNLNTTFTISQSSSPDQRKKTTPISFSTMAMDI